MSVLGVTRCNKHGAVAVQIEGGGFDRLFGEPWTRTRFRCGCSTSEGPAPHEKGDLVTITDVDGTIYRGIVTAADGDPATGERITMLGDPFD